MYLYFLFRLKELLPTHLRCLPMLCLLLVGNGINAQTPADEDFGNTYIPSVLNSLVVGDWTFTCNGSLSVVSGYNVYATPLAFDEGGSDYALAFNEPFSDSTREYSISATSGNEFALQSFDISTDNSGASTFTIEGKRDGITVTPITTIDVISIVNSISGVSYTYSGSILSIPYGTLSFGADYGNIDEIKIVFSEPNKPSIDNIDVDQPNLCTLNASISSQTNIDCSGANTGAATAAASNGTAPYTYNWSNGATSESITNVPAGMYTVTVTDANNCTVTTTANIVDESILFPGGADWPQLGTSINGLASNDQLGASVALSGDGSIMAVAAPYSDENGSGSGSVKVYKNIGGLWQQLGDTFYGITGDNLGTSIALSDDGSVLAIGAPHDSGNNLGYVSVYVFNGGQWNQIGSNITDSEWTGFPYITVSLSQDGNTLAVGGMGSPIMVYYYDGSNWTQKGANIDPNIYNVLVGVSVSLSNDGNTLAIGSRPCFCSNTQKTVALVYHYNGASWIQLGTNIESDDIADFFGGSVSLSGNGDRLAVGAFRKDVTAGGDERGEVRVYSYNGTDWNQIGAGVQGVVMNDHFGYTVSISDDGNMLAVGIPSSDNYYYGHAEVYYFNGGNWIMTGYLLDTTTFDNAGTAVALSGDGTTVAIGATNNDNNGTSSGQVHVYTLSQEYKVCYGGVPSNLSYETTPMGGSGNYTYLWEVSTDNGVTWAAAPGTNNQETYTPSSGITATTLYRRAVTDASCTTMAYAAPITVSTYDEIVITANVTNPTCGQPDGEIWTTISGGTPPYTYLWTNTATTQNIIGLYSGTYGLTVTDANGCNTTFTVTLEDEIDINAGSSNTWNQLGQAINGDASYDRSGYSVSLSADGMIMAVASPYNNVGGTESGSVKVYQNIGGIWQQIGQAINGEASYDRSGYSVSLSADGSTVAIGSPFNDNGHVRIYQNVGGTWQQVGQDIDGEAAQDQSGVSVSLSADGNIVAIGAPNNDGNGNKSGHVRIYQNVGGIWQQLGQDIDGEAAGDESGYSISLAANGSVVAIGSRLNDDNGADSGHVRVYQNVGGIWQQLGADIDGEAADNYSGFSVSLAADGSIVAIGAPYNDGNDTYSGHVRVYQNVGGSWQQIGQDIDGEEAYDYLGRTVSLSSDGSRVAIGVSFPDDGIGQVVVYQNLGGEWQQLGQDIYGEVYNDQFGYAVSLSADGSIVAVGVRYNNDNGYNSGQVRVFNLSQQLNICYGELPGTLTYPIAASGGDGNYTYLWEVSTDNGATWAAASGTNNQETYTPTSGITTTTLFRRGVIDASCTTMVYATPITVSTTAELVVSSTVTAASCGNADGGIAVTVSGGTAPYTYLWSNGATTESITGVLSGTYMLTVTDTGLGCVKVITVEVPGVDSMTATTAVNTLASCVNAADGSATVSVTGGSGSYTYLWDTNETTATAVGLNVGTHTVTITDTNGCFITETVTMGYADTTAPVADVATLADVTAQCMVIESDITAPTATDNCGGLVTVTHNVTFPIIAQGTTVITWTYADAAGNQSTQTQNVIINDITAPVADAASLADVTAQCMVAASDVTVPTATDNCSSVTVTHNVTFPITTQGTTVITWTYTDVNGNSSTQTQNVIITDTTAPVANAATLADVIAQCTVAEFDVTVPTATDNCSAVTVTHNATFPITTQGTTVITWTYTDVNGNSSTQTQNVVITDTTAPVANTASLPTITMQCAVLSTDIPVPTATDNCAGVVTATTTDALSYDTTGTYTITWSYNDGNGNTTTQIQTIVVLDSALDAVTFTGETVTYDTTSHAIVVSNLPAGATVSYSISPSTGLNNAAVDAGTYTVTATVSPAANAPNCDAIVLTATLIIEQATQEIIFDPLALMHLETDPDFQLMAYTTSGLPVYYTYTYTAINPPATVSNDGWVTLLTSGLIEITAHQDGNNNYLPATSVMQPLQINSNDASIHEMTIGENSYVTPGGTIHYLMDCSIAEDAVYVNIVTEANATAVPGHEFYIDTPQPGIFSQEVTVTSQDGTNTQTFTIIVERMFPFFDIVVQKFDNVLLANNNPETNGGYSFVAYEWFKNGELIGTDQYVTAGPDRTDLLDANADYYLRLTTASGDVLQTCIGHVTYIHDFSITVTPNPVLIGKQFTVSADFPLEELKDMQIAMYDLTGRLVYSTLTSTQVTTVPLADSIQPATYLVVCTTANHQQTFKIVVH